jgi:hypothetical protein
MLRIFYCSRWNTLLSIEYPNGECDSMLLVHPLEACSYQFGNAQIMWYWSINAYTNDAP